MSAASRAKAAQKESQKWLDLLSCNHAKLAQWLAVNPACPSAAAPSEGIPYEPVPHWVLPIGESLVNPDYFYPPTAEMNGKPSPILTVRAFHHPLTPVTGITFDRPALGAPWVRVA